MRKFSCLINPGLHIFISHPFIHQATVKLESRQQAMSVCYVIHTNIVSHTQTHNQKEIKNINKTKQNTSSYCFTVYFYSISFWIRPIENVRFM